MVCRYTSRYKYRINQDNCRKNTCTYTHAIVNYEPRFIEQLYSRGTDTVSVNESLLYWDVWAVCVCVCVCLCVCEREQQYLDSRCLAGLPFPSHLFLSVLLHCMQLCDLWVSLSVTSVLHFMHRLSRMCGECRGLKTTESALQGDLQQQAVENTSINVAIDKLFALTYHYEVNIDCTM